MTADEPPEQPTARYRVRLRRHFAQLNAVTVEHEGGGMWRIVSIATRIECDDEANVCWSTFDRMVERRVPSREIVEILTLADADLGPAA